MGILIEGVWHDTWDKGEPSDAGHFQRASTKFRNTVETVDLSPPKPGRYHLYVSWACPWAHRTLIYRKLKGLEHVVGVSYVDPLMGENGWTFGPGSDPINNTQFLWQLYTKAEPSYSGKASVPVLWDCARETIVNNESSEIIRIFDNWPGSEARLLRPPDLATEIDTLNDAIYLAINDGVYRVGFATTQAAYDQAFDSLFAKLDYLEEQLAGKRFLTGEIPTEPDWRLFTTLVRFDAVYYGLFKCNRNRLIDFPELWDYTRALYQQPGIAETVRLEEIKRHYYGSHGGNACVPIIPKGPRVDFLQPSRRMRQP